ncbi:MAG TPA: tetratricopeptide repeat protein, partial [Dongiaceae bacterium]|nr:tetratricopeptide repeat protein [Dongiaceae bacterium]
MNRKTRRRAAKAGQRAGDAAPLTRRLAAHLQRARAELGAGRPADAEASCRLALQQRPDHPDALDLLGVVLMEQGRLDAALDCFRCAAAAPGHALAEYHMGRALKRLGRLDEAVASYRRVLVSR